ncbi:hypothetical protein J502_1286 [Acinetobacter sp. 1294596]|uniref:Uncharacterized protein n=1 Tax=Acinetobacter radioresistens SK82 TaxID=596318 RepID=A0ABP2GMI7_ACIRA|nr:hypothetical protein ACIRA0001_2128 [Acinetobacter radioresistens SK82]EJO34895.1 putative lipoprotein [Acinetobacter radioresistens WC-A-157]EXB86962.1 hypothetical protein J538_1095 [Acinetobacter sp. 272263]EXE59252.1 hypothetical protein J579_1138 [Acinetobacter sp. 1239920]EXF57606.1 hypothetical protein J502_1286 [Acinetobacter sp. 1294596]
MSRNRLDNNKSHAGSNIILACSVWALQLFKPIQQFTEK